MTTTTTTAQITLAATEKRDESLESAIERIKQIMLPGARALAGTRTSKSDYWIERDLDISHVTRGRRAVLNWRDQGVNTGTPRAPYDADRPSYAVQIILPDDVTPGELAEISRIATYATADLVRECVAQIAGQVALLESERDAFDAIAK